ncbi:MAG: high-potential iron-sulfur protein [Bradymonadia bacterium]
MSNTQRTENSRREFLLVATGLSVVAGSVLFAGCGGKKDGDKKDGDKKAATGGDKKAASAGGGGCTDISKLNDAEKAMRTQLKYIDISTNAEQNCANCQLYQAATGGAACGGCAVVKGPINPKGWCASWAKKVG